MKKVLVPLDGSKLAEEALPYALNILEPDGSIVLVCAVEAPDAPIYGYYSLATVADYEETPGNILPFARNYLESVAERLTEQHLNVTIDPEIGDPSEVITLAAARYHVDTIVMSTHGRSGISRWLLGSVADKVLSAKPCPVYIIPSKETSNDKQ